YRLARGLISREVEAILELGVDVRTNCRIGADVGLGERLAGPAALFLAAGPGRGRDLDVPGRELDGVLRAVEFLLNVNQGFRVDLGERVVVVGGGNVAFDAARTGRRGGHRRVARPPRGVGGARAGGGGPPPAAVPPAGSGGPPPQPHHLAGRRA